MIDGLISSQPALYDRLLVLSGGDEQRLADMAMAATLLNTGLEKENRKRALMRMPAIQV